MTKVESHAMQDKVTSKKVKSTTAKAGVTGGSVGSTAKQTIKKDAKKQPNASSTLTSSMSASSQLQKNNKIRKVNKSKSKKINTLSSSVRVVSKKSTVVVKSAKCRPVLKPESMTRKLQAAKVGKSVLAIPELKIGEGNLKDAYHTVGKRKSAVARVWLKRSKTSGSGWIIVNDQDCLSYFSASIKFCSNIVAPFVVTGESIDNYDIFATMSGGGKSAQSQALSLALSKLLVMFEPHLRMVLKKVGLLTVDARKVEPKKIGLRKARKREQFSKR